MADPLGPSAFPLLPDGASTPPAPPRSRRHPAPPTPWRSQGKRLPGPGFQCRGKGPTGAKALVSASPGGYTRRGMDSAGRRLRVSAGLIVRDGRLLICQRGANDAFPLKWEFPGGKVEEGEEPAAALARELREELGIRATVGAEVARVQHAYPGGPEVDLVFYSVPAFAGEPANRRFAAVTWAPLAALPTYDFLEADRPLVSRMAQEGRLPEAP